MQARLGPQPHFGFPGVSTISHLFQRAVTAGVGLFFTEFVRFVARIDVNTLRYCWSLVSATTEPTLAGPAWDSEFTTMTVIAAALVLPLLCAATIQAIAQQDASGLLRTAFVRIPLALLFTGVAVEIVSLGLQATDQACGALIADVGHPLRSLFTQMTFVLAGANPGLLAVNFLYLVLAGFLAFMVWLELAVRSAAIAVATLFFPLALAGSAFPATAHWARRLGETITALVLSKLAIVAVLTLAVGTLGEPSGGVASVVEGITLLGLAAIAPIGLARILPMVEAGAIAHLDGMGRHSLRTATNAVGSPSAWMSAAGGGPASGIAGFAGTMMGHAKKSTDEDGGAFGGIGGHTQPPPPDRAMRAPALAGPPPGSGRPPGEAP
jgi:hypothetical protein